MSKPEAEKRPVRVFVALDLPQAVCADLARWGEKELVDPALRRVPPGSLHITLVFLGNRKPSDVERIGAAVRECGWPAPKLRLGDLEQRPLRGRARLFVAPVHSDEVEALQADLQARLVGAGLYEAGTRPFWPHVTVARVRAEGHGSRRPAPIARSPKSLPQSLLQPSFKAVRLTFYRSELQPRGARYVPLAQAELPGTGQQ